MKLIMRHFPQTFLYPCGILGCIFACILTMFLFCIPYQDELAYAYKSGMSGSGELEKITSIYDIVQQQKRDYCAEIGNGRVMIHSVLAWVSSNRLNIPFRIVSTCVWFLFTLLILKHGRVDWDSLWKLVGGVLAVYCLLWNSETTCHDASYTINYLWCATLLLTGFYAWEHLHCWNVPIGFLIGVSQETFALPACCALGGRFLLDLTLSRCSRKKIWLEFLFCLFMSSGVLFLLSSPAGKHRAGCTLSSLAADVVKGGVNFCLYIWPLFLFLALLHIIVVKQRNGSLKKEFTESCEWYLLTAASLCMLLFIGHLGVRTMMPYMMGASVIVLRNRSCFRLVFRYKKVFSAAVLIWMMIAAVLQFQCGRNACNTIVCYVKDPQGITCLSPVKLGPWVFSCYQVKFLRNTNRLIAADWNKDCQMTILPCKVYDAFYLERLSDHSRLKTVGNWGYYFPGNERCVIKKGAVPLTSVQQNELDRHFNSIYQKRARLKRLLPQRLLLAWPREDVYAIGPPGKDRVVFTSCQGNAYTAFFNSALDFL